MKLRIGRDPGRCDFLPCGHSLPKGYSLQEFELPTASPVTSIWRLQFPESTGRKAFQSKRDALAFAWKHWAESLRDLDVMNLEIEQIKADEAREAATQNTADVEAGDAPAATPEMADGCSYTPPDSAWQPDDLGLPSEYKVLRVFGDDKWWRFYYPVGSTWVPDGNMYFDRSDAVAAAWRHDRKWEVSRRAEKLAPQDVPPDAVSQPAATAGHAGDPTRDFPPINYGVRQRGDEQGWTFFYTAGSEECCCDVRYPTREAAIAAAWCHAHGTAKPPHARTKDNPLGVLGTANTAAVRDAFSKMRPPSGILSGVQPIVSDGTVVARHITADEVRAIVRQELISLIGIPSLSAPGGAEP